MTHAVDYADAAAAVGDDYLTDNSDVTGAGVRVQVIRNSDSTLLYDGYVAESGSSAGCALVRSLSASETYKLRVLSMGYVNDNFIKVWNNDDDQASCEGAPDPTGAPSVDGDDYHGDVCGGTDNKGVEYDWLRFFWDLVTDESIPVSDVFEIWDRADPDAWNTDGSGVAEDLSEAADTGGWGAEYDDQAATNGTDH